MHAWLKWTKHLGPAFQHFYKNQKSTAGKNGRKVKDLAFTFSSFPKNKDYKIGWKVLVHN